MSSACLLHESVHAKTMISNLRKQYNKIGNEIIPFIVLFITILLNTEFLICGAYIDDYCRQKIVELQ